MKKTEIKTAATTADLNHQSQNKAQAKPLPNDHSEHTLLTDLEVSEMENDALWDLLQKADSPVKASPMFSRNVMREIRLMEHGDNEATTTAPQVKTLWSKIASSHFSKIPLGLGAAAACVLLVTSILSEPNSSRNISTEEYTPSVENNDLDIIKDIPLETLYAYSFDSDFDDSIDPFAAEILELDDQDPLFLSEEDIALAMNY